MMDNFKDEPSLQALRMASGLSLPQLAERLDVPLDVMVQLDSGRLQARWREECLQVRREREETWA